MLANEICYVPQTSFRDQVGSTTYPAQADRYWLFTSKLCPFAHRTEIMRSLKGLQEQIGLTVVDAVQTADGWNLKQSYVSEEIKTSLNPLPAVERLPGIYKLASPGYKGRASVPVLFDMQRQRIVNNESSDIVKQLDASFSYKGQTLSFYLLSLRDRIIDFLASKFIDSIAEWGLRSYSQ